MREEGLIGRSRARRRVQTTDSRHSFRVADNLLERRFTPQEVARPNRRGPFGWECGDITYLPTAHGWVYLATVKDLFSRRIVGWAVDDSLEATLVATAWQRALKTRGFAAQQGPELYHSDRGSQYCGELFQKILKRSGTQPSMSGKGECLDNAVAESFFGTLKAELLADQPERRFASKTQAALLVGDYIDNFYNSIRKHSALGNKCPIAFELAYQVNAQ
jgi:putative transposase